MWAQQKTTTLEKTTQYSSMDKMERVSYSAT